MQLNVEGFASGALSGYKAVLGKKMEEDYQTQRDEAMANRQMNLETLRNNNENLRQEKGLTAQKEMQQTGLTHAGILAKQNQEHSEKMTKMQIGAASADRAAARAEANADRDAARALQEKLYSGGFDKEKSAALATSLEKTPLGPGETQAERDAKITIVKSQLVKDAADLSKLTTKDLTFVNKLTETSLENTAKKIQALNDSASNPSEATAKKIDYINNNYGIKFDPKKHGDPDSVMYEMDKKQYLSAAFGTREKVVDKVTSPTQQVVDPVVFNQLVKDRASLTPESPNYEKARSAYLSLTPEDRARVDKEAGLLPSPGLLSGIGSSISDQHKRSVEQTRAEQQQRLPKWN